MDISDFHKNVRKKYLNIPSAAKLYNNAFHSFVTTKLAEIPTK